MIQVWGGPGAGRACRIGRVARQHPGQSDGGEGRTTGLRSLSRFARVRLDVQDGVVP